MVATEKEKQQRETEIKQNKAKLEQEDLFAVGIYKAENEPHASEEVNPLIRELGAAHIRMEMERVGSASTQKRISELEARLQMPLLAIQAAPGQEPLGPKSSDGEVAPEIPVPAPAPAPARPEVPVSAPAPEPAPRPVEAAQKPPMRISCGGKTIILNSVKDFKSLLAECRTHFGGVEHLEYQDDDGDWVTMSTDQELETASSVRSPGAEHLEVRVMGSK